MFAYFNRSLADDSSVLLKILSKCKYDRIIFNLLQSALIYLWSDSMIEQGIVRFIYYDLLIERLLQILIENLPDRTEENTINQVLAEQLINYKTDWLRYERNILSSTNYVLTAMILLAKCVGILSWKYLQIRLTWIFSSEPLIHNIQGYICLSFMEYGQKTTQERS